jgi:hypothetical protein
MIKPVTAVSGEHILRTTIGSAFTRVPGGRR